ncbi:MAG: MBL fold metallo-hydrolase [Dehalococcoidia bacterium]|nr:MBL fold metallo-hydrolase [Dehalococcoidia bacterium]
MEVFTQLDCVRRIRDASEVPMTLLYNEEVRVFWTLCGSDNNNAYLIVCPQSGESIIIDAPLNPGRLLEEAKGTQVKAILITHKHRDHLEGLKEITDATGAPVAAHRDDAADMPIPPNVLLDDGDTIRAGTVEVTVIHTPGHTPGSVCYLVGTHLFTGDTLYAHGPGESRGVEATQQILRSITEKLYRLPDDTFLLPGHGGGGILGAEKERYRFYAAQYPDLFPPIPDVPPLIR